MEKPLEVIFSDHNGQMFVQGTGVNYGTSRAVNYNQYTGEVKDLNGVRLGALVQRDYKTYLN